MDATLMGALQNDDGCTRST